ncbi:MAG: glycosyltransferase family 2 protein [Acidobacteria bacterium]|nr:glycosyltransferase family 2 protein [Acidobacteriota bacterium]
MTGTTAIIVTCNSVGHIEVCIESCHRQNLSIIVVDNASTDGTAQYLRQDARIRAINNYNNNGFAGAANQATILVDTEYCLLLNPDAELLNPIDDLVAAVEQNGHTAATGQLVSSDGAVQKGFSFRRFPTPTALALEVLGINRIWPGNPVNRWYRCLDVDHSRPQTVEQPAGAFLLFRRSDWERLGGFDEGFYPVWFEDVDFCKRIANSGGTTWYDPSVRARHFGGHSVQNVEFGERNRIWYGSLLRYAAKHFSKRAARIVAVTVGIVIFPRVLLSSGRGSQQSAVKITKSVWSQAWRTFWSAL